MIKITRENLLANLSEEDSFSLKILTDRYFLKESNKNIKKDDVIVVEIPMDDSMQKEGEETKYVKEVALADFQEDGIVYFTYFTGVDRGTTGNAPVERVDVCLEKSIEDIKGRLSNALGDEGEHQKKLYDYAMEEIMLGGRILAGAGTKEELTLFNCYVAPRIHDSRDGIADHRKLVMNIMSRGGGVGTDGSTLRPSKTKVHKVRGRSSGSVSWLDDLSQLTDKVQQGGSRRGAQMITMLAWHPDILDFITAKVQVPCSRKLRINGKEKKLKFGYKGNKTLTGANISVLVPDALVAAARNDGDWKLVFPDVANYTPEQMELYDSVWDLVADPYKLQSEYGLPYKVHAVVKAKDILDLIAFCMWRSAEPAPIFIDQYNKFSNSWYYNPIISTNPCGEQGLPPWGVCNLGHINLSKLVRWDVDAGVAGGFVFDFEKLKDVTRVLVRALDNVIDVTPYHFEKNKQNQQSERRLGLGTLGVDEVLKLVGFDYGTEDGRAFAENIFKTITLTAYDESSNLAKEKGCFASYDKELISKSAFMNRIEKEDKELYKKIMKNGLRNVTITTQAPTGTTGTMAQTSTGIEPFFAGTFFRQSRIGFTQQTAPVIKKLEEKGIDTSKLKYAMDYTIEEHLKFQAVVQKWTDSSISKTINAPKEMKVEEVASMILDSYDLGLKGFTMYRDGSREEQVLSLEETKADTKEVPKEWKRESDLAGRTHVIKTAYGNLYVTINRDSDGKMREMFLNIGKAGSDTLAMVEGYGRLISVLLQKTSMEAPEVELVKQLRGIGGNTFVGFGENKVTSIPDAIGKAVQLDIAKQNEVAEVKTEEVKLSGSDTCAQCGGVMMRMEGCFACQSCGSSKCN